MDFSEIFTKILTLMQQHELPNISRFGNDLTFEPKTRNNGKQLARSKIDSNFKLLSSVCESFPSILSFCMQKFLILLAKPLQSFHSNRPESTGILHH